MSSQIEENYLKAIFKLSKGVESVSTSALAAEMGVQAASVTDMIKRLSQKKVITYKKYRGVNLTEKGKLKAVQVIRKHRLWEVFLVNKLGFNWGDVHEVAEQLEHINSAELTEKLDAFLGYPQIDPHGDPIPDKDGNWSKLDHKSLSEYAVGSFVEISGVAEDSRELLELLEIQGMLLGENLEILERHSFDGSMKIRIDEREFLISDKIAKNVLVIQIKD